MEDLVDAFLYLGPQDLRLNEQLPADIALDIDYRMELARREALPETSGVTPEMLKGNREWNAEIVIAPALLFLSCPI